MREFLLFYLGYNLVVGMVLTTLYLIKYQGKMKPLEIAFLLVFPAIGLGKSIYAQNIVKGEQPAFPEKWFMWKYMVKVNWGFMAILALTPVVFFLFLLLGISISSLSEFGFGDLSSLTELGAMVGSGMIALVVFFGLIMALALAIPYLIFIYVPKHQMQMIERSVQLELIRNNQARSTASEKPAASNYKMKSAELFPLVDVYVKDCINEFKHIPKDRRKALEEVAAELSRKLNASEQVNLMFICTHNSRRSQFAQVWAAVAAAHYGIRNVHNYSGGTEATAFNKRAVAAIERAGLLTKGTVGTNPRYAVRFSDNLGAIDCYSKTFDDPANPQKGFIAIMTCSDADENCPLVPGADFRSRITYEDPKVADRTEEETQRYDARCQEIATEMLYLFSKV
ncbi:MAG: hypothetical protein K9J17_16340 [Flavobacteriales bacterium]|nr:hypothetical protein [Flavobacteriales bacterium]